MLNSTLMKAGPNMHEQLNEKDSTTLLTKAIQEAERGNGTIALMYLGQVPKEDKSPLHNSYVGYCMAKEHKQLDIALSLCKKSIRQAPQDPSCYLNLGRVCLLSGHKRHAIKAFRQSLKVGCLPQVISELQQLGIRKSPPIPSLPREHFLNRHLGYLFRQLSGR